MFLVLVYWMQRYLSKNSSFLYSSKEDGSLLMINKKMMLRVSEKVPKYNAHLSCTCNFFSRTTYTWSIWYNLPNIAKCGYREKIQSNFRACLLICFRCYRWWLSKIKPCMVQGSLLFGAMSNITSHSYFPCSRYVFCMNCTWNIFEIYYN